VDFLDELGVEIASFLRLEGLEAYYFEFEDSLVAGERKAATEGRWRGKRSIRARLDQSSMNKADRRKK
jgi:hypothetical protein